MRSSARAVLDSRVDTWLQDIIVQVAVLAAQVHCIRTESLQSVSNLATEQSVIAEIKLHLFRQGT